MNDKNEPLVIRISPEIKKALVKEAAEVNTTTSELVRRYILKGLSLKAYQDELELIHSCTESAVRSAVAPQIERLVKLLMKIGKINGAGYYLQLSNLLNARDREGMETTTETVRNCNRLALKYMSQKDSDIEAFLLNNQQLASDALHIKSPSLSFLQPKDIDPAQ